MSVTCVFTLNILYLVCIFSFFHSKFYQYNRDNRVSLHCLKKFPNVSCNTGNIFVPKTLVQVFEYHPGGELLFERLNLSFDLQHNTTILSKYPKFKIYYLVSQLQALNFQTTRKIRFATVFGLFCCSSYRTYIHTHINTYIPMYLKSISIITKWG